jgi:hypothetical protein
MGLVLRTLDLSVPSLKFGEGVDDLNPLTLGGGREGPGLLGVSSVLSLPEALEAESLGVLSVKGSFRGPDAGVVTLALM